MIFGDISTFAVDVAPLPDNDTIWHRGAMVAIWIGGERLGDPEASEPLGPLAEQLRRFLDSAGERHGAPFVGDDTEDVLDRIATDVDDALVWYDKHAIEGLSRYRVTTVPSLAPLEITSISYERSERLIWRKDGGVHETFLSTKQVESACLDFLAYETDLRG